MNWILLIIVIASAVMLLCFVAKLIKGIYRIVVMIINRILSLFVSVALIISWPIRKLIKTIVK